MEFHSMLREVPRIFWKLSVEMEIFALVSTITFSLEAIFMKLQWIAN